MPLIISEEEDQLNKIWGAFIEIASANAEIQTLLTESVSGDFSISKQELSNEVITGFPRLAIYPEGDEDYIDKGNGQIDTSAIFNFELAVDVQDKDPNKQEAEAKILTRRLLWSILRIIRSSEKGINLKKTCSYWKLSSFKFSPIYNPETNVIIFSSIMKVRVVFTLKGLNF